MSGRNGRHAARRGDGQRSFRATVTLAGVLVLAVAAIIVLAWPSLAPATAGVPGLPNPQKRMLLGAYVSLSGFPSTEAAIYQRETAMGRRYDLEITYYNWTDPFPDAGEPSIVAHGTTPVMTWFGPGKHLASHRTLAEILDGHEDAWILQQARAIRRFHHRIFLRLMPEMNGNWYKGYSGHPAEYIAAWRRIYNLFQQAGATNVTWVWCPNVSPANWDAYYPGNAYVNVIGVDGYNNTMIGPWRSFAHIFDPFLRHFAGRKPEMIGETATNPAHGGSAAYISGMHHYLETVGGPRYGVIAVCWFDTNTADAYNWRVDQTPAAWRAWLSLARDPYFGGKGSRSGVALGRWPSAHAPAQR